MTAKAHRVNPPPVMPYPVIVPWRSVLLSLDNPLRVNAIVSELSMFPNKKNWGSTLQRAMMQIPDRDFMLIEAALKSHTTGAKK